MERVFSEYSRRGLQCLIQFWQCSSPQGSEANGFNVTTKGQPFRIPQYHIDLDRYRRSCVDEGCSFVGQNTKVGTWLVGRAVQKRVADQGTKRVDASTLGLFVMPVFLDRGTRKQTVGIIELVTLVPKPTYGEEFVLLHNLLKNEGLVSEGMAKMIKVEFKDTMIKFPLSFTATLRDLKNEVRKRVEILKTRTFSIKYKDTNGKYHPILIDHDLEVCINESVLKETTLIRMVVKLAA
ncbi:PB1 domain-containing protein [Tanacetum coccineum]